MTDTVNPPIALRVTSLACVIVLFGLVAIAKLNSTSVFPSVSMDRTLAPQVAAEHDDVREVSIRSGNATLYGWVLGRDDAPRKFIRFMGNAEHIGASAHFYLRESQGAQTLLFDYRGRGNSSGKPSERAMYQDALAAWSHAVNDLGWQPASIILWGRSLGCVPATWLAHRQVAAGTPPGALVLESAFTNARDMARRLMPWLIKPDWLVYSLLDNASRASALELPVFQLHGEADTLVPLELGKRLHEALPGPKQFLTLPGTSHNNIWNDAARAVQIRQALDEFLQQQGM
jgi:uncharacterized protein